MQTQKPTKAVCYYRVSTTKQGLGIEAQKNAVAEYLAQHPEIEVIDSFTEEFSGKEENRPEFNKAVELCRRSGATLLAAKLDRIGRGRFLYGLLSDKNFSFKVLDIAGTSDIEMSVRVGVAIEERNRISERTSGALQAKAEMLRQAQNAYASGNMAEAQKWVDIAEAKSRIKRGLEWWATRNFKLGSSYRFTEEDRATLAEARTIAANTDIKNVTAANAVRLYLKQGGKRTLQAIADYLNERHYPTRRGGLWKPASIKNLMTRFDL